MKNWNSAVGIIALSGLKGIGPAFCKKAVTANSFSSQSTLESIQRILSVNSKIFDDEIIQDAIRKASEVIARCSEEEISIVEATAKDYPSALKEIKDPPPVLYCKGNLQLLSHKTLCVIGTRKPNERGEKIAERIGAHFSNRDWVICNGLAEGIDSCSIMACGKIHGKVIGVLAGGLDFSKSKTLLKNTAANAEKLLSNGGLLVSENPPGKREDTFSVVKSCRIQAGLSQGLILVESSIGGGSRFTAKAFCETERPFAVAHPMQLDFELPAYSANKAIIEFMRKGLAMFTELKEDKIRTKTIFVIQSKDDYQVFESLIAGVQRNAQTVERTLL